MEKKTKFYRYQDTAKVEANSQYVDLLLLKEDLKEYLENGQDIEELYEKYETSLQLRATIEARELFNKVVAAKSEDEVEELVEEYLMKGLFGEEVEEINESYSFTDLIVECPWKCVGDTYLVVYEGEKITQFGDDGVLFAPEKIVAWWKR